MQTVTQWAARHGVSGQALDELLSIIDPGRVMTPDATYDSESQVQSILRVTAPKYGCSLWRNNNGASIDETGRHIRFGLGNDSKKLSEVWKSSDLIGITPMTSTAVGQTFGVFTAVEVKKPGWKKPSNKREIAQEAFLRTVRSMGGIGMFAQSVDDYRRMFGG